MNPEPPKPPPAPTLIPPTEPVYTPVALPPEPTVPEAEAIEHLERLGNVKVDKKAISGLQAIGIHVKGSGIYASQRGWIVLNQTVLQQLLKQAMGYAQDIHGKNGLSLPQKIARLKDLATIVSMLSKPGVDLSRAMLEWEKEGRVPGGPIGEEPIPTQKAFEPGKDVRPAILMKADNVHIHEAGK